MNQDARKVLAQNIKKIRESKSLKREELSLLLGFDNSYISKIEKSRLNITIDRLEKIAKVLDVETWQLLK